MDFVGFNFGSFLCVWVRVWVCVYMCEGGGGGGVASSLRDFLNYNLLSSIGIFIPVTIYLEF